MPSWLMRLLWGLRGKRRVRLHLFDRAGGVGSPSFEGILAGCIGSHYVLLSPSILSEPGNPRTLEGLIEVPRETVVFVQVLG